MRLAPFQHFTIGVFVEDQRGAFQSRRVGTLGTGQIGVAYLPVNIDGWTDDYRITKQRRKFLEYSDVHKCPQFNKHIPL